MGLCVCKYNLLTVFVESAVLVLDYVAWASKVFCVILTF